MKRTCESCGTEFEAKRNTAKFCGATCRVRASRAGSNVVSLPSVGEAEPEVVAVTRRSLEEVGRLGTPLGQMALELAKAMAESVPGSGAKAQIAKQFGATFSEAMKGTRVVETKVDELRRKRDALRRSS